jgi:hypothetical protein
MRRMIRRAIIQSSQNARHVTGCRLTQQTKVYNAVEDDVDDVVSVIESGLLGVDGGVRGAAQLGAILVQHGEHGLHPGAYTRPLFGSTSAHSVG